MNDDAIGRRTTFLVTEFGDPSAWTITGHPEVSTKVEGGALVIAVPNGAHALTVGP